MRQGGKGMDPLRFPEIVNVVVADSVFLILHGGGHKALQAYADWAERLADRWADTLEP